ncbi:MAG: hypothetical protein FJY56_15800 [Betaproteobacteria bacterium]|nr:hypothetical protein [Betaproteobacteria bacterium]
MREFEQGVGTIEHQYPNKPGWLTIIAVGVGFAACAAILARAAQTNTRGISLFRIITLDVGTATVFLWVLAALAASFVVIALALVWHRFAFRQRIAITSSGIILPEGRWSRAERFIPYAATHDLETVQTQGQRFLYVYHDGGKHIITAAMLPSKAVFEVVCALIAEKRNAHA